MAETRQKALMRRFVRHSRAGWLAVPAMALVFALVTVWGSFAHACHGADHGQASEVSAQLHNGVDGESSGHHGEDADAPATPHPPGTNAPPCCADLTCHGGVAIFATGLSTAVVQSNAVRFVVADQSREGLYRVSLDRPPRTSVQF